MTYAELHCHSYFSLLDGASSPEALVQQAALLGMLALALTDHDAVYGAVRFVQAARTHGVKPVLGAEMTLDGGHHLTLLVQNDDGWRSLCQLITLARRDQAKGQAALPFEALAEHHQGLLTLSGCRHGTVASSLLRGDAEGAFTAGQRLVEIFGRERCWIELQAHRRPEDDRLNQRLIGLSAALGVRYVATNNVHYATHAEHRLHDVLVAIRHRKALTDIQPSLRSNSEYFLKDEAAMAAYYAPYPLALSNTLRIADQCQFDLSFGLQELPVFPTPNGHPAIEEVRQLCEAAIVQRQLGEKAHAQLSHELGIIERSGLSNYFLIVWDLVRFAREAGILCQGRGSAANSLVAYLLGISPVNPLEHDLVFERFLSDERQAVPDIDIDFQADRREEVIQYVYNRYGTAHAAMACTFVTFRARSALREVGLALGLPADLLTQVSESTAQDPHEALRVTLGSRAQAEQWQTLLRLCDQIKGVPRHLGIHNGGMVIMGAPLADRLPTEPATMEDRVVVQWDKDGLESAGLVKIDLLGLRILSVLAESDQALKAQGQSLGQLTFDDPGVFDLVSRADTVGVFQVESRAQAQVLPRLQPRTFNDLIVSISLIRPGPVQGQMVHPYLRRRAGVEVVSYYDPKLIDALSETLGVVLFQEQVLKVARDLAGFTPGQGEQLRRALGAKDAPERIAAFAAEFIAGAAVNGVAETTANTVFDALRAFGGYAFPKSHAAAFAVLVYQSAWLKTYHPALFFKALLNHQPMGFWSPAVLVSDAKRHGITVLPVDVQHSQAKCTLEEGAIRLGLTYVKGVGDEAAAQIEEARSDQRFTNLADLVQRTQLSRRLVEALILAGACDGWGLKRRQLLWQLGTLDGFDNPMRLDLTPDPIPLPTVSPLEALGVEFAMLGVSLHEHVLAYYRPALRADGLLDSQTITQATSGSQVRVAGLLLIHQAPPTAKGHHFLTLEDEHGFLNVVVRPTVYTQYRQVLHTRGLLVVNGQIESQGGVWNIVARNFQTLE